MQKCNQYLQGHIGEEYPSIISAINEITLVIKDLASKTAMTQKARQTNGGVNCSILPKEVLITETTKRLLVIEGEEKGEVDILVGTVLPVHKVEAENVYVCYGSSIVPVPICATDIVNRFKNMTIESSHKKSQVTEPKKDSNINDFKSIPLFLTGNPNLESLHQGSIGDCFLISVLGQITSKSPTQIRLMFELNPEGGYIVNFKNGTKISISNNELDLLKSKKNHLEDGLWLLVIEKALGKWASENQNKLNFGHKLSKKGFGSDEDISFIAGGGDPGDVIRLFTGHKVINIIINNSPEQREDIKQKVSSACFSKHIIVASTSPKATLPGMPSNHAFGVLGIEKRNRDDRFYIKIWNPWGNQFEPKGIEGEKNGYRFVNGIAYIPLDVFCKKFYWIGIETDANDDNVFCGDSFSRNK